MASTAQETAQEGIDLQVIHDFLTNLSLKAGDLLRKNVLFRSQQGYPQVQHHDSGIDTLKTVDKDSSVDIVTDVDVAVENFIISEIKNRFPDFVVLAEETYSAGGDKKFNLDDRPTVIVDPLDGTVNLTHMFPLVCISLGFAHNREAQVGAIYAPLMDTLWSGCNGRGSFQSNPSLDRTESTTLSFLEKYALGKVGSEPPLSDPSLSSSQGPRPLRLPLGPSRPLPSNAPNGLLFASEWGKDRKTIQGSNLRRKADTFFNMAADKNSRISEKDESSGCLDGFKGEEEQEEGKDSLDPQEIFGGQVHGVRSLGSAALDLAFCAAGSVDVFWEGGCWEWDVCAGIAILTEAGGIVVDSNPPSTDSPFWKSDSEQRIPRASLGARRFLCVRACAPTENETSIEAQQRVVREVWKRTRGLNYLREGVVYPK